MKRIMILCAAASLLAAGCAKQKHVGLRDDADSVAYIIGMNVGMNLLRMDSTLRADVVCEGLRDAMRGATRMTREEARDYYLRYVAFERPAKVRAYEERFLEEIRQNNRSYARTASGVTYTVESVGEERAAPSGLRDTVVMRYVMRTVDGRELYSSYERGDTVRMSVRDLLPGLPESVRLIGRGGRMVTWLPAAEAYGAAGDAALNVQPNATLCFEIELIDVKKPVVRGGR